MGARLVNGVHGYTYTGASPPPPGGVPPMSYQFTVSQGGNLITDRDGSRWLWDEARGCYVREYWQGGERREDFWTFGIDMSFVQSFWSGPPGGDLHLAGQRGAFRPDAEEQQVGSGARAKHESHRAPEPQPASVARNGDRDLRGPGVQPVDREACGLELVLHHPPQLFDALRVEGAFGLPSSSHQVPPVPSRSAQVPSCRKATVHGPELRCVGTSFEERLARRVPIHVVPPSSGGAFAAVAEPSRTARMTLPRA